MLLRYWPESTKIKFMSLRMGGALLSVLMITASIYFLAMRGLNLGVDFAGGTVMEIQQTETVTVETVRAAMPFAAEVNSAVGTDARAIIVVKFGAAS
jgi:preprotein translocase subunit SecF